MVPGPWNPTCCFTPVTLFELVKVQILEYVLRAKSNTTVMAHSQKEEVHRWRTWIRVRAASIQTAGPEMLKGDAPLWPTGFTESPFSQLETQCPHAHSLLSKNYELPVCLVDMITFSLHRRNHRSPCVGIDGYFDRGDLTSLSLLLNICRDCWVLVSNTAVHSEENMKGLCPAAVLTLDPTRGRQGMGSCRSRSRPSLTIPTPHEYKNWKSNVVAVEPIRPTFLRGYTTPFTWICCQCTESELGQRIIVYILLVPQFQCARPCQTNSWKTFSTSPVSLLIMEELAEDSVSFHIIDISWKRNVIAIGNWE